MKQDLSALRIAYFSAEVGLTEEIPTYSGGLGILAGDHIRSAADLGIPMCAVTLLYREGYFQQHLEPDGSQVESYPRFDPAGVLERLPVRVKITLRDREVCLAAWRYNVVGHTGAVVPAFFLDTDLPENDEDDRCITRRLYSGGPDCRILQEAVLGFGGVRLLQELGITGIETYHLNEGHTAFLTMELVNRWRDVDKVRERCVFTTHTPVPAGHDLFPLQRVDALLDGLLPEGADLFPVDDHLNMTRLALGYCRAVNGVSRLHREVAQSMFPGYDIGHVTNGVHHLYWTPAATKEVYDEYLPGWRADPGLLRNAACIPGEALRRMHQYNKEQAIGYVNDATGMDFSPAVLTIGFARRAVRYKRAQLLFTDPGRLADICEGRVQFLFAGKAHPSDQDGMGIIREVVQAARGLGDRVRIVYLENYNIRLGRLLTSGVDVWLNTPLRPNEASGTSGMKAALNGVPSLSVLDGWWDEGCRHGENGWAFGDTDHPDDEKDAHRLYQLLEEEVIPTYYNNGERWLQIMKQIIVTGADFTSQRMVTEYDRLYYRGVASPEKV